MKMETILGLGAAFAIGMGVGYCLIAKPAPPAPAAAVEPWAIPSPGAGYAEQHFPNIHKYMGPAEFYTVPTGSATQYTDGSIIYVD